MSERIRYQEAVVVALAVFALVTMLVVCVSPLRAQEVRALGMQVVGSREVSADSMAAIRVVVTDHIARKPAQGAVVTIWLIKPGTRFSTLLLQDRTDARGTVERSFAVPNVSPEGYEFVIRAQYGGEAEETRQAVRITAGNQVLLTTDTPLYKPTQVVHVRALALRKPSLRALAGEQLTFEISDPKGNKVFKQKAKTNDFGVAFTEFQLGDEINLGDYRVVCLLGDERVEKNITVKRYVLPKFRVVVTPDKQYYLPGETARGTVQVDYFFGKPVTDSKVKLTLKTFDVAFKEIAVLTGNTDSKGTWKFETRLPNEFVGQPLEQGKAFLQFEAEVTDQAEHTERAVVSSRVAAAPLEIHAVPESGTLVPGVENIVYVMVSRPTGEPVKARVRYEFAQVQGVTVKVLSEKELVTDELGLAELRVVPEVAAAAGNAMGKRAGRGWGPQLVDFDIASSLELPVNFSATATDGTKAEQQAKLPVGGGSADTALLLRTDKVLSRVGDTVEAVAYTGAQRGTVYFDVVKDRQTMLTLAADIEQGKARVRIPLTPELSGTVWVSAYRIQPHGEIVRATRPVYVNPANDLNIAVRPDKDVYRPGPDNIAKINFAVTDPQGRPVAAALGVNVVDESLFAIQEMQPGLEKVYFYLEKELATPRYEIHGYEMPNLIGGPVRRGEAIPLEQDALKQEAARVMMASVKAPETAVFSQDTYAERLEQMRQKGLEQLRPQAQKIQQAIEKYNQTHEGHMLKPKDLLTPVVQAGLLKEKDLVDPWGTQFALAAVDPQQDVLWNVILWSWGPDKEKGTEDDLYVLSGSPWTVYTSLDEAREMRWGGRFLKGGVVMAVPMAAAVPGVAREAAMDKAVATNAAAAPGAGEKPVRVRQFFPETLLVEPALITDGNGKATLNVPMADSITSWRITALANSMLGALGSTTGNLRCFQDFFIDIDLPVALTQGDRVSVPVAVYNYLPEPQKVRLELAKADWFELTGPDKHELEIGANDVDVRYFTITARKIGSGKMLVHGYGSKMSDAIERVAEVEPNGKLFEVSASGRLSGRKTETLNIPAEAIADASNILVKVYPGIFSQAVEGLDSILRMPSGCFEQTSSSTYPNVLVLDYMKTIGRISPEIQMKAEGFINNGYQRLVTFEVQGGGFSWFGDAPANKVLTAFGLMEFHDMARVHEVDPNLIARTQQWLLSQQGADGAWEADKAYLHQEAWGRIQNSKLPPTAYVAWGLTYSACKEPGVAKAISYLREHTDEAKDAYVLAMVANALVNADLPKGALDKSTEAVLDRLVGMAKRQDGQMWWETQMTGITHSSGQSSDLEATGMAALALIAAGRNSEATEVLNYLIAKKDPQGTWYSTQATTLALRALMASQKASTSLVNGEVSVMINGQQAAAFGLTPENADVMRQVDGRKFVKAGANEVTVKFEGKGSTLYQVVGKYYLPWEKLRPAAREELDIKLAYDRTTLNKDDMVTADVTVKNNLPVTTSMIIVDLGIPPGFEVQSEDFANLVEKGTLQKYSLTGRQIICYLEKLDPQQTVSFSYRLRAKFPIKAQTPKSRVYEYYNPERQAEARPVDMVVQ
ncbi:MAG: MG2 domain-containing protein [Armatimonadia bacterium]